MDSLKVSEKVFDDDQTDTGKFHKSEQIDEEYVRQKEEEWWKIRLSMK